MRLFEEWVARGPGRSVSRARLVLTLLVAGAFGGACRATPAPTFGSGLAQVPVSSAIHGQERAMAERLNRDRAAKGLAPLRFDPQLSEVARHHSADMRDHRFFEHDSPRTGSVDNRLDAAGYAFLAARENLSEAPDIERSQDGLLDSPPHYVNIMAEDVTHVGIGIVKGGVHDPQNLTVTQVFARPLTTESSERALGQILGRLKTERAASRRSPAQKDARLMQLAARHLETLDEEGSPASVERAGRGIVEALDGKQAAKLLISTQRVPSSDQFVFPDQLREATKCSVGLAVRRVRGEKGRPALQVLLLVHEASAE
jgi:uncharacterized protein YkwD